MTFSHFERAPREDRDDEKEEGRVRRQKVSLFDGLTNAGSWYGVEIFVMKGVHISSFGHGLWARARLSLPLFHPDTPFPSVAIARNDRCRTMDLRSDRKRRPME